MRVRSSSKCPKNRARMMARPEPSGVADLAGYEVLVAVSGGIAAYKTCDLVSKLVQRGVGVTAAMTRSARRFVGVTTFQALTGRRVLTSIWTAHDPGDVQHIALTGTQRQAELMQSGAQSGYRKTGRSIGTEAHVGTHQITGVDELVTGCFVLGDDLDDSPALELQ